MEHLQKENLDQGISLDGMVFFAKGNQREPATMGGDLRPAICGFVSKGLTPEIRCVPDGLP